MGKVMTAKEFADKAKDIAENYKTLYVMGCFGAPMTASNKQRYTSSDININNPYNMSDTRKKMINAASVDTFGFDCVCLIKGILWGWSGDKNKVYGGAIYGSNSVPDVGADKMITYCDNVSTTNWTDMVVGEALWKQGHIGIYIGDGFAVECTPDWKNKVQITVVANIGAKSGYNSRRWTKHGKLPYVDYVESSPTNKVIQNGSSVKIKNGAKTYTGGVLASFAYDRTYTVMELSANRAVVGIGGIITAAVNVNDLILVE